MIPGFRPAWAEATCLGQGLCRRLIVLQTDLHAAQSKLGGIGLWVERQGMCVGLNSLLGLLSLGLQVAQTAPPVRLLGIDPERFGHVTGGVGRLPRARQQAGHAGTRCRIGRIQFQRLFQYWSCVLRQVDRQPALALQG